MNRYSMAILCIGILTSSPSYSAESKCDHPPYGGTNAEFKSFIENLGFYLDDPVKLLKTTCNAKFHKLDRESLYNLGITDADIASKSPIDLAVEVMTAMRSIYKNRNGLNE